MNFFNATKKAFQQNLNDLPPEQHNGFIAYAVITTGSMLYTSYRLTRYAVRKVLS